MRKNNSKNTDKKLKIIPLGGIGEIGKNMTVIEYMDEMIVIDCGLMFPSDERMLGVDYVIPDMSYLEKNRNKLKGIFITHGHEDHIGAVPYILADYNVPVFGTALTIALIESKMQEQEHSAVFADLNVVNAGETVEIGKFDVEFIRVSHSIDDAVAFAVKTPCGTVVHTGDFKVDLTPVGGKIIDLSRFAELGKKGVLALLSDSTNAERHGMNVSESNISDTFIQYFKGAKGRIIVATFASNVHRLQQVIDAAKVFNKKVCFSGRSMVKIVNVSRELELLSVDDDMIIDINKISDYKDNQVVILSTGSQGETMSGLVRMATGQHPKIAIKPDDTVILSATPIPGNEKYVYNVINLIYRKGATVVNDTTDMVHVSGHACQEELKLMLSLVRPKYFIPVHGEYRHLYKHAALAEKMGIAQKNIFISENGFVIELSKRSGKIADVVQSGSVIVDGLGVGDVGQIVLRDRKQLGSDGIVIVIFSIDPETGKLAKQPDIISRGFVYMREAEDLIENSKKIVTDVVDRCYNENIQDIATIKNVVKKELSKLYYDVTMRNPMIMPIVP